MPQIRLRKPKAILFDINGTATYTTFSDRVLATYIRKNVRAFIHTNWGNAQVQRDLAMIKGACLANKDWPQVSIDSSEAAQDSVEKLVNFTLDNDADCMGLAQLR